jgi:integrase
MPADTVSGPLEAPLVAAEANGAELVTSPPARADYVGMYLASLDSQLSRKNCSECLRRVLRVLERDETAWRSAPWHTLTPAHGLAIRARLVRDFSAGTAQLTLTMLRGVLRAAFQAGCLDGDTLARVIGWPKVKATFEETAGRMLSDEEVGKLRGACASQGAFTGALDMALLACGLGAGCRREEMANLRVGDVSEDAKTLRVCGKRRKVRMMPLPDWASGVLEAWLAQRARYPFTHDRLFTRVREGRAVDQWLTKDGVHIRLKKLGQHAGVNFTPHDLRRTYLSVLLDHSRLATVQKLAGHADPRTTVRYDRRPERAKQQAMRALEKWGPKPAKVESTT